MDEEGIIALVDVANQMMDRLGAGSRTPCENLDLNELFSWTLLGIGVEPQRLDLLLQWVESAHQDEKSKYD